jgi:hypothetical protein|nr:MAG: hypothetical protein J07AB56_00420 [Candidatus Nanosalinarum sp. J07AB56]
MEHVYGGDIIAEMEENPDVAREFGSKLREAHASSVAFRDFNTGNFVDEQGALVPVDAEVFTPEANLIDLQLN